jgi:hypothetical protein
MPGFLFQNRQSSFTQEDHAEQLSSTASGMVTSSIHGGGEGGAPSYYSGINEDSRVDSLFSSLQSNQSNMRVNPNTPAAVCTVRLDGGIVHHQNGTSSPPPQHQVSPSTTQPSTSTDVSTCSNGITATPTATITGRDNIGEESKESFDKAFEKMAVRNFTILLLCYCIVSY